MRSIEADLNKFETRPRFCFYPSDKHIFGRKGISTMRGLKGKNVVLTGGASGIGQAISLRLGEEGCNVGILT